MIALLLAAWPASAEPPPYYEKPRQGDGLTFWGWSPDGRRFAYETWADGGGLPLDCYDEATLTVRDADRDRPVADGVLRSVTKPGVDRDHCVNPDVRATLASQRPAALGRHQVVARAARPLGFDVAAGGNRGSLTLPSGHVLRADLAGHAVDAGVVAAHPDRPACSYRLTLAVDGAVVRTVDAGPWPGALRTALDDARVFVAPSARFAAICLPVSYAAHHGVWAHWDCHGAPLTRTPERPHEIGPR